MIWIGWALMFIGGSIMWFGFVNWATEAFSRYLMRREVAKLDKKIREAIDLAMRLGPPEGVSGVFDPRPTAGKSVYARVVLRAAKDLDGWEKMVADDIDDLVQDVEEGS